ncbi:hypothetical protein P305_02865 [Xylella fastidiosa subsp. fastidiosa Mus-1]|nr:hypothetical protein P305_02865 [Xylella fastidiosa subsp. fastidiosa Mus-1]
MWIDGLILLYCCIAVLLYCCIAVLLYCCIAVLLYCCIAVQAAFFNEHKSDSVSV